jgi:hypothetical protein
MALLATIVLSVALWWPGGGMAQSDAPPLPPPFCGELSEADCQLLADAQELMSGVSSMNMALALDTNLSGIPEVADEELSFGMNMDMTLHLDPALNEAMREITTRSPEELLATMDEFTALVIEFYETLGMRMEMEMALPGLLRDAIEADEGVTLPDLIAVNMRLADGYAYIDMDALAASFPDMQAELDAEGIDGWIGVDFVGQMRRELDGAVAAPDVSALQSMQMSMAFNQMMLDETLRSLLDPYIIVERLADEERDGAAVAVFRTSLDLGELVSDPDFTQLLRRAVEAIVAAAGEEVDEQELRTGILGAQLLATLLARSAEFEIVQTVGLDTPPHLRQQRLHAARPERAAHDGGNERRRYTG